MNIIVLAVIGLLAQFIDGSLGMGYGVTSTSVLISIGFLPSVASASVHTAEIFTTLISGISHIRIGNFRKDIFFPLVIFGMIGGITGATILSSLPGKTIKPYIAVILLILGLVILLRFWFRKKTILNGEDSPVSKKKLALLGFIAALVDAIGGGGWGPIATPTLILSNKTTPRIVVGTVNAAEFFITLSISLTFIFTLGLENFMWKAVLALIIGGVISAPIAAYTCKKIPTRLLGILIGLLLMALNLRTIIMSLR